MSNNQSSQRPQADSGKADLALASRVMIIDDEPVNIKVARKYLQIAGYENFVVTTDSVGALGMIRHEQPDVILLDIMMPQVSGLEILGAVRADPELSHLPVIILTASSDANTKHSALELGATDFLAKPVDANELVPRVRNALLVKAHHDHLKRYSDRLEHEVCLRTAELEASRLHVVHALARAAEYRDDDTGRHVMRVGRYCAIIARDLGYSEDRIAMLEMAAQLHDVGKIGIPDAILLKPGPLDEQEFAAMRRHCEYGYKIINPEPHDVAESRAIQARLGAVLPNADNSPMLAMAATIAMTHHEHWDGNGYPHGLKGQDIPLEGRITAVADVFDALSSKRPYKKAFPLERCIEILQEGRRRHFDDDIVAALLRRLGDILQVQSNFADAA
jgi:putative two-component system response regulator